MRFRSDDTLCRSCRANYPASALDRYLWCPECRRAAERRSAIVGRVTGFIAAIGVGLYVVMVISPSDRYLLLYAAVIALAYVLIGRIARALLQGFYRSRGTAPQGGRLESGERGGSV